MNQALAIQCRVIWALILRETRTRFGRHRLGYLWAVLEPAGMIMILTAIFTLVGRLAPSGLDFPVFLATGIVPFFMFRTMLTRAAKAIEGNRGLLVYARVKPLDLVIARGLLEAATYLVVFVLILLLLGALGYQARPHQPLVVLSAMATLATLGFGLGAAIAAFQVVMPSIEQMVSFINRPLLFISGIFFSVEVVPEPYRSWLLLNPILHAIELIRAGFFATYSARYADPGYLLEWVAGAVLLGLVAQRALRRSVTVAA